MNIKKIHRKYTYDTKRVRNLVIIISLLATTTSFVEAKSIPCEREVIGGTQELKRVMHRKDIITEETAALIKQKVFSSDSLSEKATFSLKRYLQETEGENVLEIRNNNSKPLTITLLDQGSDSSTELGVVQPNSTEKFRLDRKTLYDTYSVKGYLGLLRSDTYANLSFKKFYTKIVFQSDTIGTTAQLEKADDIY